MPEDAIQARLNAVRWLKALEELNKKQPQRLNRRLYLVPGLTDERGGCWQWINEWGARCISNWAEQSRVAPLFQAESTRDFTDFGYFLRTFIEQDLAALPAHSWDVVCHSMGGTDTYACLVDDAWNGDQAPALTPPATHAITLDTPFRGFINFDVRMRFPDISNDPARTTQCTALGPGSPQLARLLADRARLSGRAAKLICYSAEVSSAQEVATSSSDLCADFPEHATPWAGLPTYTAHSIPGVSHSGPAGITASPVTIAHVFDQLLFK